MTFLLGFIAGVLVCLGIVIAYGSHHFTDDPGTLIADESLRRHERHDAPSETPEPSDPIHRAAQFTTGDESRYFDAICVPVVRELDKRPFPKSPRQLS